MILDEVCIALQYELLTLAELLEALRNRNPSREVIVTDCHATQELIEEADFVIEVCETKHERATLTEREGTGRQKRQGERFRKVGRFKPPDPAFR